ncbi:MAG: type II toxin-antitoxin system VapC family toxin [Melioribacteraceae bacterium]|nr:type II toxin-antitoxin system VapC family toxin [Melioribacteraceae bacterium]MCF8356682.1 type II toxin-antitoxin system VapC family toxin [Melioribacteraceae bacterium]MCF8395552.1 type II toxin-antitoxin system VapC family toxin [Melioribacteraceae bacterium]MCF8420852.1 type II toxin-antitoxin system VapC family toxin [Melioribacteraceae bacterium]
MENIIYLDTHVVVWLYAGEVELLSEKVKKLINNNQLFISPVVELEIQYLYEIKRIIVKPGKIIQTLKEKTALSICDHDFKHIINYAKKYTWTHDPFDRIIVAQAALNKNKLITKDKSIRKHYKNAVW